MRRRSCCPPVALAMLLPSLAGCMCGRPKFLTPDGLRVAEILDHVHKGYTDAIGTCGRSIATCGAAGRELVLAAEAAKAELARLETPGIASASRSQVLAALDRWIEAGEALEDIHWNRSEEGALRGMERSALVAKKAMELEVAALVE